MAKRLFDVGASLLLLAALWPLLLVIWLLVVAGSGLPGLFRQQRVGRHGRMFELLKFRSMVVQPLPGSALVTAGGDPRITPVGRRLRASKLDELPQLINVLRGDMSLVGPRPEVPRYVALYTPEQRARILSVRPGITDEAAILFRNEEQLLATASDPEAFYVEAILPRKLACYEAYAREHSLAGDLSILWRTLRAIIA